MRSVLLSALHLFAVLSRWLALAGFVLLLLRLPGLVPVPWLMIVPLLLSPVLAIVLYVLVAPEDFPRPDPNAGGE